MFLFLFMIKQFLPNIYALMNDFYDRKLYTEYYYPVHLYTNLGPQETTYKSNQIKSHQRWSTLLEKN